MSRELVLNQSIARIVSKENKLLATKLMMDKNLSPQLFFQTGFQQGLQQGIDQGFQQGIQRALGVEPRVEGGPVESGKEYLVGEEGKETYVPSESGNVIPNDKVSPYFEASIKRDGNNIVTESFFDTGKGRISDFYEEKTSDGKVLFSDKTEMIGSSMTQSYYDHYSNEEKYDDGGAETFTETQNMTTRISSIAKDDLIEHQDQLLGEIHKIKGFEDVTINDVIRGTTGLPKDTMFNILSNSDASFATAARTDEQNRMPTDYLINADDSYRSESQMTYNSEGVQPSQENNQFASLADSINQSVNSSKVRTVIQPVIQTQIQQVSQPVPMSSSSVEVVRVDKSQLPTSIAKMIN